MLSEAAYNILLEGIKIKVSRGESLDDILASYVNLYEEIKSQIRAAISNN